MFKTFYAKILALFSLLILLLSLFLSFFYLYGSYKTAKLDAENAGFLLTESLGHSSEFSIYSQDPTFLLSTVNGIFDSEQALFVGVYTKEGAPIYRKSKTEDTLADGIPEYVMRDVLAGKSIKIEGKDSEGTDYYDFFVPVKPTGIFGETSENEVIGIARIRISLYKIKKDIASFIILGIVIDILSIGLVLFLARVLAKTITKPVCVLSLGAKEFGKGNLGHRINIKTNDELENLASAFNEMAQGLEKNIKELREARDFLEDKVEERTKELQDLNNNLESKVAERTGELKQRVDELERFYRITVGRELRMVQLKGKVKELAAKVGIKTNNGKI